MEIADISHLNCFQEVLVGGSLGHSVWKHFLGFLINFHNFFSMGDESDDGFKKAWSSKTLPSESENEDD